MNKKNKQKMKEILKLYKQSEKEVEEVHDRLTKKIKDEKEFAISKFAKDCLEILDNFDRCFE